jgi:predicted Zn-dependent peptidase
MSKWMMAGVLIVIVAGLAAAGELNFPIEKHQLNNGLMVLLLEDHSCPTVTIQAWYRCGSKDERPGITGISHLFEHMMFKGTEKYPKEKFDRQVLGNGGYNNAWTSFDNTTFYEVMPPGKVEVAIDLESDRSRNLQINEQNVGTEKQVVISERSNRYENEPFGALYEQVFNNAYVAHPYRWLPIGFMSDIKGITLSDCLEYYHTHYAPNNCFLIIAGDINPKDVMKLVWKYYGPIQAEVKPTPVRTVEPKQRGEKRIEYHKMAQLPAFIAGFKIPEGKSPDIFPLKVAARVLFGGESSRLYRKLVYEEQKALFVQGEASRLQNPGLFYVMAGAIPGVNLDSMEAEVWQEIDKLQNEPISATDLQKAKNQLESEFIMGLQSNESRAQEVGYFEIDTGDYQNIYKEAEGYQAVIAEDVMRVAKNYLTSRNRTVVILVPEMPTQASVSE